MSREGFTLPEILCVLAIVAALGAGAAPSFVNAARSHAVRQAVREVRTRLLAARFEAVVRGEPVRVRFSPRSCFLERYRDDVKRWVPEGGGVLDGAVLDATGEPVFYPTGTVAPLASITVSNRAATFRITVAITGRLKTVRLV